MLTTAKTPIISRIAAVTSVSDSGNLLSPPRANAPRGASELHSADQKNDLWPARIVYPIGRRRDQRHHRLEIETKRHRAVNARKDIGPEPPVNFHRPAVPVGAPDKQKQSQRHNRPRHGDRQRRWLDRAEGDGLARTTQRKPTWLVDVSMGSAWRAAGRYRRQ